MKLNHFSRLLVLILVFFSCSSEKEIIYLNDISVKNLEISEYKDYLLKVDDILKIEISSQIPEASMIFKMNQLNSNVSQSKDAILFDGYQINTAGYINLPILGSLKVLGLSVIDVRNLIHDTIISRGILNDPSVDVKLANAHFIILGEVNVPGRHSYLENNLNILEAIAIAGDLTIFGKRNEIKLIRFDGENKYIKNIDLTSKDFLTSENFQINSGDIILVNPNKTRVKNAGIIGNSGTLLSLLSFILSSIIVINNN